MTDVKRGLKDKYRYEEDGEGRPTLTHTDGHPIDRSARYFILRLDKGANPEMRAASRVATRAFALMIQGANPEFAADIFAELAGSLGEGEKEPWDTMEFWVPDLTEVRTVTSQALNKQPTLLEGPANGVTGPLLVTRYGRPYVIAMSAEVYVFFRAMHGFIPLSGPETVSVALAAPVLTDEELARLIEGGQVTDVSIEVDPAAEGAEWTGEILYARQEDGTYKVVGQRVRPPLPKEDDYPAGSGKLPRAAEDEPHPAECWTLPDEYMEEVVPAHDPADFAEPGEA